MFETFPDKEIDYNKLIDGRLAAYGIKVDIEKSKSTLKSDAGATTVLLGNDGWAEFSDKVPASMRNAIAKEFNLDLFPHGQSTHVVISLQDKRLMIEWVKACVAIDLIVEEHRAIQPSLFAFADEFGSWELAHYAAFTPTAQALIRIAARCRDVFSMHLHMSIEGAQFALMVGMGLFVRHESHYRIAIPQDRGVDAFLIALKRLLETEDDFDCMLHPERYLVTMSERASEQLCERLRDDDDAFPVGVA